MNLSISNNELTSQITAIRHELHRMPELLYDLPRTSQFIASALRQFGCDEVVSGLGRSGVVGIIHGRGAHNNAARKKSIGLRADMDALPIAEENDIPYASQIPGQMHACGHDGHSAMLLGACALLAETRDFDGRVIAIFQPAEEGGAGAKAMMEDGLFERFPVDGVFGLHNLPGLDLGTFAICEGPIMASADKFHITLTGKGGHAAQPHLARDPVLAAGHLIVAAQSLVSRTVDPQEACVVSLTTVHGGTADNIIPDTIALGGTIRALSAGVRVHAERRLRALVANIAASFEVEAACDFFHGYPVCRNHPHETALARAVAHALSGKEVQHRPHAPMMAAEDFAFMLEECPGAYMLVGNGQSANLHASNYNFNDALIPVGVAYWVNLAKAFLMKER